QSWIGATRAVSISLEQSSKYVGRMRSILLGCRSAECKEPRRHPEIAAAISQLGRPDDGTDPVGFYNIELFAPLAKHREWRSGMTQETLTPELPRAPPPAV